MFLLPVYIDYNAFLEYYITNDYWFTLLQMATNASASIFTLYIAFRECDAACID